MKRGARPGSRAATASTDPGGSRSYHPKAPQPYIEVGGQPGSKREFSLLVQGVYNETYTDQEEPHPHPMFTRLRKDRPKYVAMQIYAGIMNGHSLTESVAAADIDFDRFEDHKWSGHPQIHRFDALARSYIWGKLRGIRFRANIINELADRPNTRRELGYGTYNGKRRCPHQTNFNDAWNDRFGPDLRNFIEDVVEHVREWAYDNNRLIETTELIVPDDRDETTELTKDQIRRLVNEMVGYMTPNFTFGREGPIQHNRNIFFQLLAHCAFSDASVHGGGDTFEWQQINDDDPPHGRTFLDLVEAIPKADMLRMFSDSVDSIVTALQEQTGLYGEPAPIAIDTTTIESDAKWKRVTIDSISNPDYHDWTKVKKRQTWEYIEEENMHCLVGEEPEDIRTANFSDPEKVAAAERISDVVRYVHGTKSGGEFMYAWEFAAAAIAHPTCPLVYAMEPLDRKDVMENHVERFIRRGQDLVTVSEVYMDSAYAQVAVFNLFHYGHGFRTEDTFDMPYVMNIREDEDVQKAVLEEGVGRGTLTESWTDNENEISIVKEYYQYSQDQKTTGYTTLVGLPKRDRENGGVLDVEDPLTDRVAFSTNRTDINAENAPTMLRGDPDEKHDRGYTNRWLIEIGFQKIKDFLAFTKSGKSGIRLFYTLYATLLFNVWMTVDRTIKKREHELADDLALEIEEGGDDGPEFAVEPRITADVLSVIVANYLRPIT